MELLRGSSEVLGEPAMKPGIGRRMKRLSTTREPALAAHVGPQQRGGQNLSDEVFALIERHVAELKTTAAMERLTAVDGEHGVALGALVREKGRTVGVLAHG
jgi:hypothetical protein